MTPSFIPAKIRKKNEDRSIIFDPLHCSSDISKLIHLLIHSEYQYSFNRMEWDKGKIYFENPDKILNCSKEDLKKLTTVILRQERFSTGTIASAIDSGMLENICKRILEIEEN